MRVTTQTDFSFRVLIYLAANAPSLCKVREIADTYSISHNHLTKVVHNLSKLGYVETHRGKNGGIQLAMSPDDIALGDVLQQVESEVKLVECFQEDGACLIDGHCGLKMALAKAMQAFTQTLNQYTLNDIVAGHASGLRKLLLVDTRLES